MNLRALPTPTTPPRELKKKFRTRPAAEFETLPHAARRLGIAASTLRDAVERKEIPVFRPGKRWQYLRCRDVNAWMCRRRIV